MKLDLSEEWLRRMATLENNCEVAAGLMSRVLDGKSDAIYVVGTGALGYDVYYFGDHLRSVKLVHFGSHRRAKRFVRHLRRCRRVGDGPTWGAPVDVRVSAEQPRWRR